MTKKRRPRLGPEVRARVVQLRAYDPERPMPLDRIVDQLSLEGFDPVPSRGSVQNIVKEWENLPEEVRMRDLPFEWHSIGDAEIPWEASEWVLECKYQFERQQIMQRGKMERLVRQSGLDASKTARWTLLQRFTNRWATWCWRLHQAARDLPPWHIISLASVYVYDGMLRDLTSESMALPLRLFDDWLAYRPDQPETRSFDELAYSESPPARHDVYRQAMERGLVEEEGGNVLSLLGHEGDDINTLFREGHIAFPGNTEFHVWLVCALLVTSDPEVRWQLNQLALGWISLAQEESKARSLHSEDNVHERTHTQERKE